MTAFTNISDVIAAVTAHGQLVMMHKTGFTGVGTNSPVATIVGQATSLWLYTGYAPAGSAPTTVAIPTRTTNGAMKQTDATGGRSLYLLHATALATAPGALVLYDRLLHIGNLSGTVTTAQTVGGVITRNTGGVGNEIWVEIYTQIGATGTTITASYTNQAGTSGKTTTAVTFGATNNREAQRMIRLPLASGDSGVQSIQSVTVLATTGTAGAFGVTLVHPLAELQVGVSGCGTVRDYMAGLPDCPLIEPGACLAWIWLPQTASVLEQMYGSLQFAEK